ncbi:MAG: TonB-dependent receptor [Bacteroidetes bacterium]|nr:TonB-dependent receptor [Bacteroidota bacterium]MBU1759367.1 TonB-dependent receptor [Bacteroidota bacterium]MBU2268574.1 TonB-dependent receptor [Bacteroidota bacterium]
MIIESKLFINMTLQLKAFILVQALLIPVFSKAQSRHVFPKDTIKISEILIKSNRAKHLPEEDGTYIYAGKKTNVLDLKFSESNLAGNVARTTLSQIPGINIWEMDGAGLQINIGSRGTDPHRSIEMNMRQNGYTTNSDIFGYPENHYSVPFEGIKSIQLVRGSASLQFGPQFGGMMNYVMKEADSTREFSFESHETAGSNNFFSSYNAIGGTKRKIKYYAYYSHKNGEGWRQNADFNYTGYYAAVTYQFNPRGNVSFQFSKSNYLQKIAGGLSDSQFANNSRQSVRFRNYFQPVITIPAIIFNYQFSPKTKLNITSNGIFGERNSVQFIAPPAIADTVNTALGSLNNRQVDRDYYSGFTTEARLLHHFKLGNLESTLSTGVRYFSELTKRKQKGKGTTTTDFDLSTLSPYGIDLKLRTNNYALFAENIFRISQKLSLIPGIRLEIIDTKTNGFISNFNSPVSYNSSRKFPLLGFGTQYQLKKYTQLYGNISQAYRPYIYANITPKDRIDIVDPHLKDSKGYDIDLGYRGSLSNLLRFDVNVFYLYYGNKVGLISKTNTDNNKYLFTTNIGNSLAKGFESYFEFTPSNLVNFNSKINFKVFNSLSFTHARYTSGQINKSNTNISLIGNWVEGTPAWINRTGISLTHQNFNGTLQYSYVGKSYGDAANTISDSSGAIGLVPSYYLLDFSLNVNIFKNFKIDASINNFTNVKYFTRRITYYPGPGILPGDGITFNLGLAVKL